MLNAAIVKELPTITANDTIAYDMAQPSRPGSSPPSCSVPVFDPLSVTFLEIIVRDQGWRESETEMPTSLPLTSGELLPEKQMVDFFKFNTKTMVAHNCHGKTENLKAKTKTSRQNQV